MHLLQQPHHQHLHLLTHPHTTSFYTSKRYSQDFSIRQTKKITKILTNNDHPKQNHKMPASPLNNEFATQAATSNRTLKQIHHKLTQILQPHRYSQTKNSPPPLSFHPNPEKRQNIFKITMFHKFKKRQSEIQISRHQSQRNNQPLNQDFHIKQACIQQRESLKFTQNSQRIGFKRDFLRYHGENKCFQKALRFKNKLNQSQTNTKINPSFLLLELEKQQLLKQNSLEYSSEEFDLMQMQAWKKQQKYQQQEMELSLRQN